MKKKIYLGGLFAMAVLAVLVIYAFVGTIGKTELKIKIHINEELVQQSGFGESPTFAIWLENPVTKELHAIYVTRRAAEGDWEGKAEVPVALPKWFEIQKSKKMENQKTDAISGATPSPGYFTASSDIPPESKWICWIEVNLAGDYNEFYLEQNLENMEIDEFSSGQPALIYKTLITANNGLSFKPVLYGMTKLDTQDGEIIQPLNGITTASNIFDEISLTIAKPKPKIIKR